MTIYQKFKKLSIDFSAIVFEMADADDQLSGTVREKLMPDLNVTLI